MYSTLKLTFLFATFAGEKLTSKIARYNFHGKNISDNLHFLPEDEFMRG